VTTVPRPATTEVRLASSPTLTHFPDEDPDEPESAREERHENIPDKFEEAVMTSMITIIHDSSYGKKK
jgi:hypothetical protein